MTEARRERLRFLEFEFATEPDGRCRASVVLEGDPGDRYEGAADGLGTRAAELRCAAQAATTALEQAVEGKLKLDLLGVKAVRAFDSTVVIVSLACHGESVATRLVGSCLTDGEEHRCAALAVLNATNRVLGNLVFMR